MRATNDNCRCVVCRVGHDMVTYLFDQNVVIESVRVLGLSRLVDRHLFAAYLLVCFHNDARG